MDILKQNEPAPVPAQVNQKPAQQAKIVVSQNPIKQSVVIDAEGNIVSSQNPKEAVIIKKVNFND